MKRIAVLGTCRSDYGFGVAVLVGKLGDLLGSRRTALLTRKRLFALFRFRGLFGDNALVPVVSGCGDNFCRNYLGAIVAYRA